MNNSVVLVILKIRTFIYLFDVISLVVSPI